jgi:hypothetical protein
MAAFRAKADASQGIFANDPKWALISCALHLLFVHVVVVSAQALGVLIFEEE